MEILVDLHNHTVTSGHAYSTIEEIARQAEIKGLKYVAITDHGPEMPGGPYLGHIRNMRVLPPTINGVNILKGVEANIMDQEGNLDVPDENLEQLDIVLAGLHNGAREPWDREGNTRALLKTMENERVDIIVHPGNPTFPINKEEFILGAKKTNTLVEINNSSFRTSRTGSKRYCKKIAQLCKDHEVQVVVSSDSHISFDVGNVEKAIKLLKSVDMPEELIVNRTVESFERYFRDKGRERFL